MSVGLDQQLIVVADIVQKFGLTSLQPTLRACETLSGSGPIDLAVQQLSAVSRWPHLIGHECRRTRPAL